MKGKWLVSACLMALLMFLFCFPSCAEEASSELPEWTVMFYLCGSDLESVHGFATGNLEEIVKCETYAYARNIMQLDPAHRDTSPMNVNVVLQTGGCKEWHAQPLGMDIATDRLQRWVYQPLSQKSDKETGSFTMKEETALASMAKAETLSDFIQWSAKNYPAKKYALVLWDHGGGSKTGIFIDELFGGDTMHLDELRDALAGGGVYFEAVLFDACLMANIETACAIEDYARWMIASEEMVAGKGTAMGDWLQQLHFTPEWDGERLGRWVCDMTMVKYAESTEEQTQDLLTWSVIKLSEVDRLAELFDQFFEACGRDYESDPLGMIEHMFILQEAFEFGLGHNSMRDLGGLFYQSSIAAMMDRQLYTEMLDALTKTVVYTVRGTDRSRAYGISFCYAADLTPSELDVYARGCPFPHYLALLDAVKTGWHAPDWVYVKAERLRDIGEIDTYQIRVKRCLDQDGTPGFAIENGIYNISFTGAELYRVNEETGNVIRLGRMETFAEQGKDDEIIYSLRRFWNWPAVEGIHCSAELVGTDAQGNMLFNIPIRLGTNTTLLRCLWQGDQEDAETKYSILGLWEGYDADTYTFRRNIIPLSQVSGQEYSLLYPVYRDDDSGKVLYEASETVRMYRALNISPKTLPTGTYYLDYWVQDMFEQELFIDRAEVQWDGEKLTLVDPDAWQGTVILDEAED